MSIYSSTMDYPMTDMMFFRDLRLQSADSRHGPWTRSNDWCLDAMPLPLELELRTEIAPEPGNQRGFLSVLEEWFKGTI